MKKIFTSIISTLLFLTSFAQAPTSGLVAYWPMNGNYTDAGPFAINGTNFSSTATTNNNGALNSAMNFSNPVATVAQYATHPINANLSFGDTQDFTIDLYAYFIGPLARAGGIYDNGLNSGGPGVWVWNSNGFLQINFNFKNGNIGTTNGALVYNTWQHITAVRSGTTISIYVNGVLNATKVNTGTSTPTYPYPARFGTMFANSLTPPQYNELNGKIDELRIYNRSLTQVEINQLQALLPVSLTNFSAQYNNNQTLLKWQTAEEYNSKNFIVQRSADGINFENIATITAAGNSSILRNYQYTDNLLNFEKDRIFYRLQQNDIDGKITFSKVILVRKNKGKEELLVYPNPVASEMQIQAYFSTSGTATLSLTDASGKKLLQKNIVIQPGNNVTQLFVAGLPKGSYTLQLQSLTEKYTQNIIKQ